MCYKNSRLSEYFNIEVNGLYIDIINACNNNASYLVWLIRLMKRTLPPLIIPKDSFNCVVGTTTNGLLEAKGGERFGI